MATGSAPKPDPAMGEAAMMNAQTGREYLNYMRELGDISTAWAQEDRDRWNTVFRPLEDQFVAEAANWDTAARRAGRADQAEADVIAGVGAARSAEGRRLSAMGVAPDSGRSIALGQTANLREGLARAGARNTATRQVEAEGDARMASAVNLGNKYSINPATSLGLGGNLTGEGFQGQMAGYQSQADILGQQHQMQMQSWQARQQQSAALWGGIGSLAGLFLSDETKKEGRHAPSKSPLQQVKDMPVEEYRYKDGAGDSGAQEHIGPMAQDYQKATGRGDGRMISLPDMVGTTMGAVQELAEKVDSLEESVGRSLTVKAAA